MTATKHYVVEGDETSEYYTDESSAEEAADQVVDDWEGEGDLPRPKIAGMAIMPWAEYEALAVLAQLPCIGRGIVCTDCTLSATCPVAKGELLRHVWQDGGPMNGDDLRLAPAGASDAACAVCLHMTFNRIAIGDGHVPICSTFCLHAWPRVRDLLVDRDECRTLSAGHGDRHETDHGCICYDPTRDAK